ncbi:hypothetical protein [Amycolatopsis sp. lyj-108]|uniref:hypothetical protein n=1 Tax=Amycolatopsis sp. lyj-108 TaxID=2789286 RepID=UPI00397AB3E5
MSQLDFNRKFAKMFSELSRKYENETAHARFAKGVQRLRETQPPSTSQPLEPHPIPRSDRDALRYAAQRLESLAALLRTIATEPTSVADAYDELGEALIEDLDPVRTAIETAWLHLGSALPDTLNDPSDSSHR